MTWLHLKSGREGTTWCKHTYIILVQDKVRLRMFKNSTSDVSIMELSVRRQTFSGQMITIRPDFFLRFSHIRVDLLLYESKMTDICKQYNWMAEKKLRQEPATCCCSSHKKPQRQSYFLSFQFSLFSRHCKARIFMPKLNENNVEYFFRHLV